MSTSAPTSAPKRTRDLSELLVALLLAVLGVIVLVDAARLPDLAQRGPVGPAAVPVVVGLMLLVCAGFLIVDVLRGGRGEAEGGEDVELGAPTDWRTVGLLAAAFLANVALIDRAGWPISGAVLFWGSAYALGSRHYVRDVLLAFGLSFLTFFLFGRALGIDLPAGVLEGIL
jgi:putative tricarboxylic transport membrane protein